MNKNGIISKLNEVTFMYEFHGWAVIRETPQVIDEENIDDIAKMIGFNT